VTPRGFAVLIHPAAAAKPPCGVRYRYYTPPGGTRNSGKFVSGEVKMVAT